MAHPSAATNGALFAASGLKLQALAYLVVSALALACDTGTYLVVAVLGLSAAKAGAIGYLLGLGVHYGLSRTFVFDARATNKPEAQLFLEFAASGLLGLALTVTVIATTVDILGLALLPAKVAAIAISFVSVFLIRRFVVFGG